MRRSAYYFIFVFSVFFISNFFSGTVFGQTNEEGIKQIRSMYAAVNKFEKSASGENCINNSEKNPSDTGFSTTWYTQRARKCQFSEGYSKISFNLEGREWASDGEYYYKNAKLFFIYFVSHSECGLKRYRIYFDVFGGIIRVLQQNQDCSNEIQGENFEITDSLEKGSILKKVNKDLTKAMLLLK